MFDKEDRQVTNYHEQGLAAMQMWPQMVKTMDNQMIAAGYKKKATVQDSTVWELETLDEI